MRWINADGVRRRRENGRNLRCLGFTAGLALLVGSASGAEANGLFERKVAPLLSDRCAFKAEALGECRGG